MPFEDPEKNVWRTCGMWDICAEFYWDQSSWFLPGPLNETCLVFSFSMDSFNPYHMKEAKQIISLTAIWLTLLILPTHLWYCPENMFLAGIIPGPKKPSLSTVNHLIKLLVNVLLEFFDPGIWYSHMARHRCGCCVQAISACCLGHVGYLAGQWFHKHNSNIFLNVL